eukprot:tig00000145_g8798.t2
MFSSTAVAVGSKPNGQLSWHGNSGVLVRLHSSKPNRSAYSGFCDHGVILASSNDRNKSAGEANPERRDECAPGAGGRVFTKADIEQAMSESFKKGFSKGKAQGMDETLARQPRLTRFVVRLLSPNLWAWPHRSSSSKSTT